MDYSAPLMIATGFANNIHSHPKLSRIGIRYGVEVACLISIKIQ